MVRNDDVIKILKCPKISEFCCEKIVLKINRNVIKYLHKIYCISITATKINLFSSCLVMLKFWEFSNCIPKNAR